MDAFSSGGESRAQGDFEKSLREALDHMTAALQILDSDSNVPPIIGARLEHAIDTLREELRR